ncbi:lipocalin family protein [Riemerella anatipestifer]|uniref:lipocalin family protein n=1 Tax=Bergeyella anatis TaxID=3113737 RepID=UPI002E1761F3|nr:lipocalin family protein [Bergeyella sp. RCAD1439]
MKKSLIYTLVLSTLSLLGCRDNEESTANKLVGTWKLTEAKISNGGSSTWTTISNGYTIKIKSDNTYETTQIPDCNTGTYSIDNNNVIKFVNSCGNTTIPSSYKIVSIENRTLILNGTFCTEDCNEKFQKIAN